MMRSGWGWSDRGGGRVVRNDVEWLRPFVAAAPWLTLAVLVLMMHLLSGALTIREGVLFDLPDAGIGDGDNTSLVALMLPMTHETLVFFDDARFVLGDDQSMDTFCTQLAERSGKLKEHTLLALVDRRVSAGEIMKFSALAKSAGIEHVLFAERRREEVAP